MTTENDAELAAHHLAQKREHFDKYEALAQSIGVSAIARLVLNRFNDTEIKTALETDRHMNNLPLAIWDSMDGQMRNLYAQSLQRGGVRESGGWAMSQTVCVAKHVARHHIAGVPRP